MARCIRHCRVRARNGLRAITVASWAFWSLLTQVASAQQPGWSAPPPCPDAALVTSKVEELLRGYDYAPQQLARFSGRITRAGGAEPLWVLRLSLGQGAAEKERVMEASRCEDLGDAAALAMALAIHPELELREASTPNAHPVAAATAPPAAPVVARAPVAAAPPAAPSAQSAPPSKQPAQRAAPPVQRWVAPDAANPHAPPGAVDRPAQQASTEDANELGVSGVAALSVDSGVLPETAAGFFGAVALAWGAQRFELGAGFTPGTASERTVGGAYASFSLYRGKLSACHNPFDADTGLFACALAEAGAFWARGHGVDEPDTQTVPWFAPGTGLMALGMLGPRLSLDVRGEVLFPLTDDRFEVDGERVHAIPSLVLRGSVGVDFRFR